MIATRPTALTDAWRATAEHESATTVKQDTIIILERLAAVSGISTPQLQIVYDAYPAAFAFGGAPFPARIIISTGLRRMLTVEELTAVLAHEVSHIRQRHSLLMIITNVVTAIFVVTGGGIGLAGYALRRHGGIFLVGLGIATAFAALFCRDAIARHCEFEADRLGACLCGHPEWLVSALHKVSHAIGRSREHRLSEISCWPEGRAHVVMQRSAEVYHT
jgi:heat shock protein HtpX